MRSAFTALPQSKIGSEEPIFDSSLREGAKEAMLTFTVSLKLTALSRDGKPVPYGWKLFVLRQPLLLCQHYLTFLTTPGILAITSAIAAVMIISGSIYIPLYTTLYTKPSTPGLRLSTSCPPQAGKPSWVKNHAA